MIVLEDEQVERMIEGDLKAANKLGDAREEFIFLAYHSDQKVSSTAILILDRVAWVQGYLEGGVDILRRLNK